MNERIRQSCTDPHAPSQCPWSGMGAVAEIASAKVCAALGMATRHANPETPERALMGKSPWNEGLFGVTYSLFTNALRQRKLGGSPFPFANNPAFSLSVRVSL